MMEVQHNYGIKLEHLIILLALMSGNTLTRCLPLEFANKDSDCATVSGVEILISSFCASLQTPIVRCQCWKQDLVCGCSYMQKSPSSTEADLTFLGERFRGYKCLAGIVMMPYMQMVEPVIVHVFCHCWLPYGLSDLIVPTE